MSTELVTRERLRSGQRGVWSYLSASRLNCYLTCALKFRFQYLDGLRPPVTASLFLGKVVHAGLEIFYRHRCLGVTLKSADVARRMVESWGPAVDEENMKFESPTAEQALQRQAIELVAAYLAHAPKDERPLAVEASVEAPLVDPRTGEDLGIPLVGVMDLVLQSQDGPVIADFKTSSRSSEPMEITHEIQISCYSYLFRQASPVSEGGLEIRSLIKTKTPKVEFHRYPARGEAHFRRLFSVIRAYLDDLDAGRFVFRPGFGCAMCDFRDGPCRHWQG